MKSLLQLITLAFALLVSATLKAQTLYFPPLAGDTWDQITPSDAGYCADKLARLDSLLAAKNSKAFILLKDGKIVHERYFGSFTQDSFWLWNSAGKTMTAALVGIAQQEGLLSINDQTSTYLGQGWTSAPQEKEDLITVWHQLTMTSGLDDTQGDPNCTDPACLTYLSNAGTRWAYHNGPYTLLDGVIEAASGQSLNAFYRDRLRNKIGMTGLYASLGFNNVLATKPRSMARFGLLMLNKGTWDGTPILSDTAYVRQSVSTSQSLNPSYGYLWWLNGQDSYRLPSSQINFPGSIAPSAPDDAFGALGKNGQILTVIPSRNEVWVRIGERPDGVGRLVANVLFDEISEALENARCTSSTSVQLSPKPTFRILTNPVRDQLQLASSEDLVRIEIIDATGRRLQTIKTYKGNPIDVTSLSKGSYTVIGWHANGKGSASAFVKL